MQTKMAMTACVVMLFSWRGWGEDAVVKVGSGQCALSLEQGASFAVVDGKDWSAWESRSVPRKYKLTATDRAGNKAIGYIGEMGGEEKLGEEYLTNGDMENWLEGGCCIWSADRGSISDEMAILRPGTKGNHAVKLTIVSGKNPWGAPSACISQTISVDHGRLYKFNGWLKVGACSNVSARIQNTVGNEVDPRVISTSGEWKEVSAYFVPYRNVEGDVWVYCMVGGENGSYGYADDYTFFEVLTRGKNSIEIYTDKNGVQKGWAQIRGNFNPYVVTSYKIDQAE